MKSENILVLMCLLVLTVSCSSGTFQEYHKTLKEVPLGTEVKEIESSLNLSEPVEMLVGSSKYFHRTFRYSGSDGIRLRIGLIENNGKFYFNGHYDLRDKHYHARKWIYNDLIVDQESSKNKNHDLVVEIHGVSGHD